MEMNTGQIYPFAKLRGLMSEKWPICVCVCVCVCGGGGGGGGGVFVSVLTEI